MISDIKQRQILSLNEWEQSLLFAELSMIAYNDEKTAVAQAQKIGFTEIHFFDHNGAQGYTFAD